MSAAVVASESSTCSSSIGFSVLGEDSDAEIVTAFSGEASFSSFFDSAFDSDSSLDGSSTSSEFSSLGASTFSSD